MERGRQRIGDWDIVPELNELRRGDDKIRVEPKAMDLLVFLAARPGQVVGRAELLAGVWPGVVVGDEALTQAVTKLRRALADQPRAPAYIETIPKRGYRLVAEVATLATSGRDTAPRVDGYNVQAPPHPGFRHRFGTATAVVAGVFVLIVGAAAIALLVPETPAPAANAITLDSSGAQPKVAPRTIGIAPFENLTGSRDHDYLARGIAADLATDLGTFSGLTVFERTDVNSRESDAANEIPQYRLIGTLLMSGDRLRVNLRLIETVSGRQLWTERYERPALDLMVVQGDIVARLLAKVPVQVSDAEMRRVSRRYTHSPQAYDLFLRGQSLLASRQRSDAIQARELYLQALDLDPSFARAYAALALTYAYEHRYQWEGAGAHPLQQALKFAETARQINRELPEVHWTLAFVHAQRLDHVQAIDHLKRALALNPSYGDAYAFLGAVHTYMGQFQDALSFLRAALRFDREGRAYIYELLGRSYFFLGDLDQAMFNLRQALARNPQVVDSRVFLSAALVAAGEHGAARWEADEIRALDPTFSVKRWMDAYPGSDPSQKNRLKALLAEAGL